MNARIGTRTRPSDPQTTLQPVQTSNLLQIRTNRRSASFASRVARNCELALLAVNFRTFPTAEDNFADVHVLLGQHMSAVESLSNENALAIRIVRTQSVPHDFWLWLGGLSGTPLEGIDNWIDPNVLRSVEEIIEPNLVDAKAQERIQLRGTDAWIAAILGFASQRATELKLNCGQPMMAVSLLPLYRSLATRQLPEALQQTRIRLSEMLVLIGALEALGDDFAQLLQAHGAPVTSPYVILNCALKLDLETTAAITCQVAKTFVPGLGEFDRTTGHLNHNDSTRNRSELTWSDPKLLWQITAELLAKKAELVLPRQWADVAVPWTSISDHWNALTHRLAHATTADHTHDEPSEYNADDEIVSEMIDDLLAMQADVAEASVEELSQDLDEPSQDAFSDSGNSTPERAHGSHGQIAGAPRLDAAEVDSEPERDEEYPETDMLEPSLEPPVSKIAIVEINSNTDSMFVNILRRQIATARNSDNSVCLVALSVESEDSADRERIAAKSTNGLLIWQDKLVNWLAEHPQVHEPFAFVTADGQLVVSMHDIDRTAATNIVREGLVTVLTGKRVEDQGALTRVAIPARYFGGIGSACPNAGFAAEQLIAATWRCLSAAKNQGKATIKSIEVF